MQTQMNAMPAAWENVRTRPTAGFAQDRGKSLMFNQVNRPYLIHVCVKLGYASAVLTSSCAQPSISPITVRAEQTRRIVNQDQVKGGLRRHANLVAAHLLVLEYLGREQ